MLCNELRNSIAGDRDTISAGESLTDSQSLTSEYFNFEMGFFTPGEFQDFSTPGVSQSQNYYIGIWYKWRTVVWVANRDKPLSARVSSELKLLENGNLVLYNASKSPNWSTNSASNTSNTTEVVLVDDGNLVLRDKSHPSAVYWQSFDYPTDTWLPGGKIGLNKRTNETKFLTSWRNKGDPANGIFSLELDSTGISQSLKWNKSKLYWTSGEWEERLKSFALAQDLGSNYIYNVSYISNENESYFTYSLYDESILSRFVLDASGQIKQFLWSDTTQEWDWV